MTERKAGASEARAALLLLGGVIAAVCVALLLTGLSMQAGLGCTSCHAMQPYAEAHSFGPHATLGCDECHVPDRALTLIADGLRGAGWAGSALFGVRPGTVQPGDGACRSCHAPMFTETVVARGIAVRHADFAEQPCLDCHAGAAHEVPGRHYRLPEMDDCLGCHTSAATDADSCDVCHVGDAQRREGATAWRATHGPEWQATHGMGELETCNACHPPRDCIECHGVLVPHPRDWLIDHSAAADAPVRERCVTCHEPSWCADCHGVDMPHPVDFMPGHDELAVESQSAVCTTCHDLVECEACHVASGHPDGPNVPTGHGE